MIPTRTTGQFSTRQNPYRLSVDGGTGVLSGAPQQAGQFDVTILAGNEAGIDIETLTLTVDPPDMSFALWSGGQPSTPELLQAYAIGGALQPGGESERSTVAKVGDLLILTAIVRADDPGLTVVGEASADLAGFGGSSGVIEVSGTAAGVSQADVPEGCERKEFRVATNGNEKYFMRLRTNL